MRLFRFRGAEVRCSPLLMLALPAAYVLGRGGIAALAFASLSVHEAAHAVTAKRAGCRVEAVELQPFGFVARLENLRASPRDTAAVFAAGPVASLCLAACAALLARLFHAEASSSLLRTLDAFCDQNLLIAGVNLLPALPLDGGRLLLALIAERRPSGFGKPCRVLSISGVFIGALLVSAFVLFWHFGVFNPSFALMGGFLIAAAVKELRGMGTERLRGRRVGAGETLAVRQLAAGAQVSIASAISMLPVGAYALISVVDSRGRRLATIDEAQLASAAQALGGSASLGEAVAYLHSKVI